MGFGKCKLKVTHVLYIADESHHITTEISTPLAPSLVTSVPTAPIPQKALESANPTAEIKVHQAVEVNVESEVEYNCSRNSTIENSAEIDLPNYKLRDLENVEEDSLHLVNVDAPSKSRAR